MCWFSRCTRVLVESTVRIFLSGTRHSSHFCYTYGCLLFFLFLRSPPFFWFICLGPLAGVLIWPISVSPHAGSSVCLFSCLHVPFLCYFWSSFCVLPLLTLLSVSYWFLLISLYILVFSSQASWHIAKPQDVGVEPLLATLDAEHGAATPWGPAWILSKAAYDSKPGRFEPCPNVRRQNGVHARIAWVVWKNVRAYQCLAVFLIAFFKKLFPVVTSIWGMFTIYSAPTASSASAPSRTACGPRWWRRCRSSLLGCASSFSSFLLLLYSPSCPAKGWPPSL